MLDLFCGAGGMSVGFEQAGFKAVAANDIWPIATETFGINHPNTTVITGDITNPKIQGQIIEATHGKVDVIVGGPPCQAYSLAGNRDPDDPRGKLFEEYVKIVSKLMPPIFVIENVKGLLTMMHFKEGLSAKEESELAALRAEEAQIQEAISSSKQLPRSEWDALKASERQIANRLRHYKEPVTDLISRRFKKLGYSVKWKLLNAADYGVPQLRERVFIIGTLNGVKFDFPEPTHSESGIIGVTGKKLPKWVSIGEALRGLPDPKENQNDDLFEGSFSSIYLSRNRRKEWNEPSFTIQAGARHAPLHPSSPRMRKVSTDNWEFESERGIRRLSFLEIARIQTFPDSYKFAGKTADRYTLIGNAVPCSLAKKVAEQVKLALF